MSNATGIAVPLDGIGRGAPEWVHLVPAGRFSGNDGRGPYSADAAAIVDASQAALPLLLDYTHQTFLGAAQGQPAPAAGWIAELQARADGVWGRVEWTPGGRKAIASREYRFISPVFGHDKDMTVRTVKGAGLTNDPNLKALTALNSAGRRVGDIVQVDDEGDEEQLARMVRQRTDNTMGDEDAIYAALNLKRNPKEGT